MSRINKIHHLNFLFADLDAAVERFESLLGAGSFEMGSLAARDVRTARARVGDTWLVLVAPTNPDADTVPARHLREHGEGFFLLSFGVASLADAIDSLAAGARPVSAGAPRQGLLRWQVADLAADTVPGINLQLTEDPDGQGKGSDTFFEEKGV